MKLLDKVKEIISQYELKPLTFPDGHKNVYTFLNAYPEFKKDFETDKDDFYLIKKYSKHIPRGNYGFSIGKPIIPTWNEIIEKVLDLCISVDPDFEIYQVKIKFGAMHFNVHSEVIEDCLKIDILIMNTLRDNALIY
jgi:hypothetical protein